MKNKVKTQFFCKECGNEFPAWSGKCHACGAWNSIVEEKFSKTKGTSQHSLESFADGNRENNPIPLLEVDETDFFRIQTFSPEVNRVLGGGIVPGSVLLLGGQPGIGKSTLVLQIAGKIEGCILYVSGEESVQQIKDRANRLSISKEDLYLLAASQLEQLLDHIEKLNPRLVIIDSIQTMYTGSLDSSPGSISQIKECANLFMRYAKQKNIPILLIGHITKDGQLSGPKLLEHIVDVVLQFEGDRDFHFRILRADKNRYGSTEEIGIFEMKQEGLIEVPNPSQILLGGQESILPGNAIAAITEGQKSLLIEVQALVSQAVYGNPQRSPNGLDLRRMQMILAVLEKRSGFQFASFDVFLNLAGGIRSSDPATDLAIVAALISSYEDRPINRKHCFAGETGLSGEIRPVRRIENRIMEAERMGFEKIFVPTRNLKGLDLNRYSIHVIGLSNLNELVSHII
jgi:DNA repair protein RadA/Sms